MPMLSSGVLRTGLTLNLGQIKRATRSYLRDRTSQATGTISAYAIAAGLSAAAGIFLITACLVGVTALFRWIEIKYGLFPAFGAIGALLLVAAAICAAFAVSFIRRPPPQFPSLTSRLRVAIAANPLYANQNPAVKASPLLYAPSVAARRIRRELPPSEPACPFPRGWFWQRPYWVGRPCVVAGSREDKKRIAIPVKIALISMFG
jgi:hypothetical protein